MRCAPDEAVRALVAASVFDDATSVAAVVRDVVSSPPDAVGAVLLSLGQLAACGVVNAAHAAESTSEDHLARHFVAAARRAEADVS